MKNQQNLITLKIKYDASEDDKNTILDFIKNYNNVLRFTYNRYLESPEISTKNMTVKQSELNNIFVDSWFKDSARYNAKALCGEKGNKVIFGGKKLFVDRCQNAISHEEFEIKRLLPIYSIGQALSKSNRKFQILDCETILFKPSSKNHIILTLTGLSLKYRQYLTRLCEIQELRQIPITYKLDLEYVYITFDYNVLKTYKYNVKKNRIFAIDMNPNYVGYSVADWKSETEFNLVTSGVISLENLTKYENNLHKSSDSKEVKYIKNKRKFETIEIAKQLFNLCKHYKCETFAIEDLSIKSKDTQKGKSTNRLCNNQWCRDLLEQQIKKRILASSTKFIAVLPQYNSMIGNLLYRDLQLPDMILASIEIGRRGYEFTNQYIYKRKPIKKNIIFPVFESCKVKLTKSLEEFGYFEQIEDWKDIFDWLKKSKQRYRFSLDDALSAHSSRVFSKNYAKRYINLYVFE